MFFLTSLTCRGGEPSITAAAFTPDLQHVLVGSEAGVRLLSWPALDVQRHLETTLENVHHIAFSPDAQRLLIAGGIPGESGTVELYRATDFSLEKSFLLHGDLIYEASWSPDSRRFATASADGFCKVIDVGSGEVAAQFNGHSQAVLTVAFLDADLCVSGGTDQTIRLWNSHDGSLLRTLHNHVKAVNSISVQPLITGGITDQIVSVSDDRTVRLWQPRIGRLVRFAKLDSAVRRAVLSPDGNVIFIATDDGKLQMIDTATTTSIREIGIQEGPTYEILLDSTHGLLFSAGATGIHRPSPVEARVESGKRKVEN